METPYSLAWKEFLESEAGKKASNSYTLSLPSRNQEFLINRLRTAFDAAWNSRSDEIEQLRTLHNDAINEIGIMREDAEQLNAEINHKTTRIATFCREVESVRFSCDEAQREAWMPDWRNWLCADVDQGPSLPTKGSECSHENTFYPDPPYHWRPVECPDCHATYYRSGFHKGKWILPDKD